MTPIEELVEIRAIERLKARYFRTIDTKDWAGFAELFTPDAAFDVTDDMGAESGRIHGRDRIVETVSTVLAKARTVHHGHMPEIDLIAPDAARGIWAMYDYVEFEPAADGTRSGLHGYGHYHETYAKQGGRWYISSLRLARLRIDPLTS